MSKIAVITDSDMIGSGYLYVMMPLLEQLTKMGHEVKVAGLQYTGIEHDYPFSIIPCKDLQDTVSVVHNLAYLWKPDVVMVGLDIPLQIQIHASLSQTLGQFKIPYIAITPLENGPLTMSWSAQLFPMDYIFFISELGKQEAMKAGLFKVDHLYVGVDTGSWKVPTPEESSQIRKLMGIAEDEFVILSVADNQERKNLSAAFEIVSGLKFSTSRKVRYILVTREHSPFGWKLRDLAVFYDINKELTIYERGMPRKDLWGLYAMADAYLNTSKAEGLGMPVLDAMACKVPVVATDTGALTELLSEGRGHLIESAFNFKDVWGNSRRDMVSVTDGVRHLKAILDAGCEHVEAAYEYILTRTWERAAKQVHDVVEKLKNEPK